MERKEESKNGIENELQELLTIIESKLGEGKPEDYDIEYDPDLEEITKAIPKGRKDLRLSNDILKVGQALDRTGATLEEALGIFDCLGHQIFKAKIPFEIRVFSDEELNGYFDTSEPMRYEPQTETKHFTPNHVRAAELELRTISQEWLQKKIMEEIGQLPLPNRRAELTRRLDRVDQIPFGRGPDMLKAALDSVQKSVTREMQIEIQRRLDSMKLGLPARDIRNEGNFHLDERAEKNTSEPKTTGKANKGAGELTVDQAVIFFHYFFETAKLSANLTPAKKIQVIQAVTRWSENSISNIFYDKKGGGVFRKANSADYTAFEADMFAVKRLYEKMEFWDAATMIDKDIEDMGENL